MAIFYFFYLIFSCSTGDRTWGFVHARQVLYHEFACMTQFFWERVAMQLRLASNLWSACLCLLVLGSQVCTTIQVIQVPTPIY
jgi:hypothetical protein